MQDLSLHILDIAENAVRADATSVHITITEDEENEQLTICIQDDGSGMDRDTIEKISDPFFTTKNGKKVGLGISLLSMAAQQTGGTLAVESMDGKGTCITAVFQSNHPDLKPMGDIVMTLKTLITGYPSIRFVYDYFKGDDTYHFDTINL